MNYKNPYNLHRVKKYTGTSYKVDLQYPSVHISDYNKNSNILKQVFVRWRDKFGKRR